MTAIPNLKVEPIPMETTRCPYCHDDIDDRFTRMQCASCGSIEHLDCWKPGTAPGECSACSHRVGTKLPGIKPVVDRAEVHRLLDVMLSAQDSLRTAEATKRAAIEAVKTAKNEFDKASRAVQRALGNDVDDSEDED